MLADVSVTVPLPRRAPSPYADHMLIPRRRGFILFFGTRGVISDDNVEPVQTRCPQCAQETQVIGKSIRHWFTLFFIPIFPISGRTAFSECSNCHAQFPLPADELRERLVEADQKQSQQAILLYNSLRASPANSVTLNELMHLYASMKEFDQAVSAANEFTQALHNSEQCMTTLGRVLLARDEHLEALKWFDAAIARNPMLAEAHYHKAIAHLTATPSDPTAAAAAARTARNLGFPHAEELLREAEAKSRGRSV